MNCPVCNVPLTMTDRQGVEIDYCSKCRGVWLDRGELDKIIERSAAISPEPYGREASPAYERDAPPVYERRYDRDRDDDDYRHHPHRRRKKGGFLGELFDF
jgi:uncharacterized protein